jgi:hypothetical protein
MPPRSRKFRYDPKKGEVVEIKAPKVFKGKAKWPIKSEALGVHPSQVGEARQECLKRGLNTEYTKDGRPIFTGPAHRKKHCEAMGYYDRNAGYGDPQRNHAIDAEGPKGFYV